MFENDKLLQDTRKEFEQRKGKEIWKAMLPEGPPPIAN
jgi:aminobenzoyl-glutamate utilization protein B